MLSTHELLVLSLINDEPAHGYELRQVLDSGYLAHCTTISTPQIYSVLRRLAERGYVSSTEERQNNAPVRTVYSIEKKGRQALADMVNDTAFPGDDFMFQFDVVLFAMTRIDALSTQQCLSVIRERIRVVRRQIESCQYASRAFFTKGRTTGLSSVIFDHRTRHFKTELRWLKDLEKQIGERGWETFTKAGKRPDPVAG